MLELPLVALRRQWDAVIVHHFEQILEIGEEDVLQGWGVGYACA